MQTASDIPGGLVATLGLGSSAPRLDRYDAFGGLSGGAGARRRSTSAGEDPWSEVDATHEAAYEWSVSTGTCQVCCSKPETCGSRTRYECGCGPLPNPTLDRPRLRPDCGVDHPEYLFDLPTSNEWGSDCAFTSSTSECAGVRPLELQTDCAEFACPDDAWGDLVVVHDCGTFESFVREAWCLLVANSDILTWLTCLIFGEDWSRDLTNKLLGGNTDRGMTTGPSSRVEFTCDHVDDYQWWSAASEFWYLATNPCAGGYVALSFPDGLGGWSHFCMDHAVVQKWVELSGSSCAEDRLCGLIDFASVIAHELTHIVFTGRSGDTNVSGCEKSYMFGNSVKWALLTRYPRALSAPCCSEWSDGTEPTGLTGSLFMAPRFKGVDPNCKSDECA